MKGKEREETIVSNRRIIKYQKFNLNNETDLLLCISHIKLYFKCALIYNKSRYSAFMLFPSDYPLVIAAALGLNWKLGHLEFKLADSDTKPSTKI